MCSVYTAFKRSKRPFRRTLTLTPPQASYSAWPPSTLASNRPEVPAPRHRSSILGTSLPPTQAPFWLSYLFLAFTTSMVTLSSGTNTSSLVWLPLLSTWLPPPWHSAVAPLQHVNLPMPLAPLVWTPWCVASSQCHSPCLGLLR